MAPDAPLWQIALVPGGAALIVVTLRHLGKNPRVKFVIDTGMITILVWLGCMMAYLCYHAFQGDLLSIDMPMWRLFLIAAAVTVVLQSLRLGAKMIRARFRARHIDGPGRQLVQMSPQLPQMSRGALPYEQQKRLARR